MAEQGRSRRSARLAGRNRTSGEADPTTRIGRYLERCTFPPGSANVDCAVSGGADSVALLILAVAAGFGVHAFHVDHGIRAGSAQEAQVVASIAERLGARFSAVRCHVADGPDLEARARAARHAALPPGVLFGHTMDDQAETVLLRLMRGTGPAGLAAMSPRNHPLLGIRRSETEQICRIHGIEVFEDPTNTDPRFTRNRVRLELLPLIADIAQRDVVPLLARLASQSAEQAALIATVADAVDPADARTLGGAPAPVAAEAIRSWWTDRTGSAYPPDAAAVERILAVARGSARAADVSRGWRVRRSRQRLHLEKVRRGDRTATQD